MKAMILAAGRGERMRPLSDHVPKPLLEAGGKALIEYHIDRLVSAGVNELVINHGRLGHLIEARLGDGSRHGARIVYSPEGDDPLDTGGGILRALPLLGEGSFIVVNADIWTDFDFSTLLGRRVSGAHLVLVPNPSHHPGGDFGLHDGMLQVDSSERFTYSGVGAYMPAIFDNYEHDRFPLAPLIRSAAAQGLVSAELYHGRWCDIGTPESLQKLDTLLTAMR